MNKLLSLCFLALSILTATSDNSAFSSPSDLSSLSELSSPSSAYTEPIQEYNVGVFTLSIPSAFKKDQGKERSLPLSIANFTRVSDASGSPDSILLYYSQNDSSVLFTTPAENRDILEKELTEYDVTASPSYKYIDGHLFGFTSEEGYGYGSADFCIVAGTSLLSVSIICDELDDAISIRDHLMNTLKIDLSSSVLPSSPSPAFTYPVQEFSIGAFTFNVPSSLEEDPDSKHGHTVFKGDINDSIYTSIDISFLENNPDCFFNTPGENYEMLSNNLSMYSSEALSYKYINDYLVALVYAEPSPSFCVASFMIGTGTDLLSVQILCSDYNKGVFIRDNILDSLKIDSPEQ